VCCKSQDISCGIREIENWPTQFGIEIAKRAFLCGVIATLDTCRVASDGQSALFLGHQATPLLCENKREIGKAGTRLVVLGIDTCDSRGSVAVREAGCLAALQRHETAEDFSSWLLPTVELCLKGAGLALSNVDVFAVASGPGSFTGLRVGLTAVKAWVELFGTRIVGVSRLEVIARMVGEKPGLVAASFDAQRGQIFAGLYRIGDRREAELIDREMVIAPDEFVNWVAERAGQQTLRWIAMDPELLTCTPGWRIRPGKGEEILRCPDGVAAGVAELGEERARQGKFTDALQLDANYVRRSDAEIFWKDPSGHGRR